ncbi:MAG: MBL fold metallo-hydrolase [Bacteroidaceae bacterium]|nr:MBL fold metallo-hydrolase [Bacteroidaceae bacterium]
MLQFISFGSGSCGNCSYLTNGKDAVLIDAGVGIRQLKRYFREYNVRTSLLRGILVTHDHADHTKAAGYVSAEYKLKVYATEKVHEGMVRNYHTTRKVDVEWRTNIETDAPMHLGSLSITPFVLPHDSAENVGYCIESDGEVFTLMTDVGCVTDVVRQYILRSNYVVLESDYDEEMLAKGPYPVYLQNRIRSGTGHLSNSQCAEVLAENFHEGLRNVWLCHLSEENNHPELARKTVEMKLRQYGIIAGKDFQLDVLRRGVPTGPWTLGTDGNPSQLNLFGHD